MKKIFWYSFLAGIVISSSALLFAAQEADAQQKEQSNLIALEQAVCDLNIPEINRLLQAGVVPSRCRKARFSILDHALRVSGSESVNVVKLLIAHGADVEGPRFGESPFYYVWGLILPLEQKKAKLEALLDGGATADWGILRQRVAGAVQMAELAEERAGFWGKDDLTRADWNQLLQHVRGLTEKIERVRFYRVGHFLPAALTYVVVQYVQGDDYEVGLDGVTPVAREEQGADGEQI